jgi:hypothetical protein
MLKFKWFVLAIIIFSSNIFAQFYEAIEKNAVDYLISLADDSSKSEMEFEILKTALYSDIDLSELEKTYQVSKHGLDSLKNHFSEYESTLKNISKDSALVLFNQWYLHFSNTFYNNANEKFFSSGKTKMLFFSASMSCYCTLEMCKEQTIKVLSLAKEENLDYWIVDSYEHNDLQIKYGTFFAPSVVVFDGRNEVQFKIEYDENLLSKLSEFIKTKLKGQKSDFNKSSWHWL